jgi:UDP-3-O-[3-hydroxymyristoyl] glucosamine N-acyltransferase
MPPGGTGLRIRLGDLAAELGGTLRGDPEREITGVAALSDAGPGDLTFLADRRYADEAGRTRAGAMLVAGDPPALPCPTVTVPDPLRAFLEVAVRYHPPVESSPGVHPTAVLGPGVELGAAVAIGAHAVLEAGVRVGDRSVVGPLVWLGRNARLGADCRLYPGALVREECVLGDRVILQPGAVIGADGFGFRTEGGVHRKVPQLGRVVIEDDVEIGACSTIDRATFGETRIGRGTKFDNLVHIGHNVRIGEHSLIIAQVGVGGSTTLGHHVVLAGQVGIVGHLEIGDGVQIGAGSGVMSSIPAGSRMWGSPAMSFGEAKRVFAATRRTPEMLREIAALKRQLAEVASRLAGLDADRPAPGAADREPQRKP